MNLSKIENEEIKNKIIEKKRIEDVSLYKVL